MASMIEIVSWVIAALIGFGAVVGFTGVVATSALTVVRRAGGHRAESPAPARPHTSLS